MRGSRPAFVLARASEAGTARECVCPTLVAVGRAPDGMIVAPSSRGRARPRAPRVASRIERRAAGGLSAVPDRDGMREGREQPARMIISFERGARSRLPSSVGRMCSARTSRSTQSSGPDREEGFRHGGWFGQVWGRGSRRVGQGRVRRGAGRRGLNGGSTELRVLRSGVVIPQWRVGGWVEPP
jgi:hypothetical protein